MFPWLILAAAVIVGLYLVARWWVQATPQQLLQGIRWTAAVIGIILLAAITLSGRWNWIPFLLFFVLPWISRIRAISSMRKNAQGPSRGQTSEVATRYLRMVLDHDSGAMSGDVVEGQYAGRSLADLNLGELVELWRECAREDEQSRVVLENYLDRDHGDWRNVAGAGPREETSQARTNSPWTQNAMSAEEACEILGVEANASPEDIESAYRKVMKSAHPDHGGSDWMAAKVNQAKDVLLGS